MLKMRENQSGEWRRDAGEMGSVGIWGSWLVSCQHIGGRDLLGWQFVGSSPWLASWLLRDQG